MSLKSVWRRQLVSSSASSLAAVVIQFALNGPHSRDDVVWWALSSVCPTHPWHVKLNDEELYSCPKAVLGYTIQVLPGSSQFSGIFGESWTDKSCNECSGFYRKQPCYMTCKFKWVVVVAVGLGVVMDRSKRWWTVVVVGAWHVYGFTTTGRHVCLAIPCHESRVTLRRQECVAILWIGYPSRITQNSLFWPSTLLQRCPYPNNCMILSF